MKQVAQSIMLIVAICLIHRVLNDFDWVTALLGGFLVAFYHNLFNDKENRKDANI
jgi:thiol:disulfide interchange protein